MFSCSGTMKLSFSPLAGWAFADSVLHRLAPLWVGARGLEFTWDYILQGLEANANLVCSFHISDAFCDNISNSWLEGLANNI